MSTLHIVKPCIPSLKPDETQAGGYVEHAESKSLGTYSKLLNDTNLTHQHAACVRYATCGSSGSFRWRTCRSLSPKTYSLKPQTAQIPKLPSIMAKNDHYYGLSGLLEGSQRPPRSLD